MPETNTVNDFMTPTSTALKNGYPITSIIDSSTTCMSPQLLNDRMCYPNPNIRKLAK